MRLFGFGSWLEARRIAEALRSERTGGVLLIIAAVIAIVGANSPWHHIYDEISDFSLTDVGGLGWGGLGRLSVAGWASDGLLAIFFFVAGLELKREFVAGDLRDPRRAALPVAAAVGGMAVPAMIFALINLAGSGAPRGWAIPTATDIAFALAVLSLAGRHLPTPMRTFLLALAVVDDLLAITIIAIFYTSSLHLLPLALVVVPLAGFAILVQRRVRAWWALLPPALVVWYLMYRSGIHPTVAGVLLAFTVPVRRRAPGVGPGLAEHLEHRWRPISAGVAVPVFAFFSAGVAVSVQGFRDPVLLGVAVGLIVGKTVGIAGATWVVQRVTRARLADGLSWWDVISLAVLGGVGFTVALLIGELAFGAGSVRDEHAKLGTLVGSVLAGGIAITLLRLRNRHYRRLCAEEAVDSDADGIPDVYQR